MRRKIMAVGVSVGLAMSVVTGVTASQAVPGSDHGKGPDARWEVTDMPPIAGAVRGEEAIRKGDAFLEAGSKRSGLALGKLKQELRDDATLWVDRNADPFFVEEAASKDELDKSNKDAKQMSISTEVAAADSTSSSDPSKAFFLHSNPGSTKKIFIDFNGATVSSTAWNSSSGQATIVAQPYDSDGNPGDFSTTERQQIFEAWQRMTEDYSVFDVDVTTEDPGVEALNRSSVADVNYGSHLVVTPTTWNNCGCGGVAYIGTFDSVNNGANQPAWVFTSGIGNGGKNIAEAGSHEVGHNLGLSHDGQGTTKYYRGQGAWAPIMGSGYGKPITQWSKGEYLNANQTQDDFSIIQQNGLTLSPAKHGTTTATAGVVGPGTTTYDIIRSAADVAFYKVQLPAGSWKVSAVPAAVGANLDISLRILDTNGAAVASANPVSAYVSSSIASGLDAAITRSYTAGTYYIRVDGSGAGDPLTTGYTTYGSVGQYSLAIEAAP